MGYINFSRSVRSQQAIEDFEMPKSLINKKLITDYLETSNFEEHEVSVLKKMPVKHWKEITNFIAATSWHHTSNYYNKTDHYSLEEIAEALLSKKYDLSKPKAKENHGFLYAIIKVQVWGGSFKRPKLEGYQEEPGIIVGSWFFYKKGDNIKRFKTTANKVEELKIYSTYEKLIKDNKKYKGTKVKFNQLVKSIKKIDTFIKNSLSFFK